MYEVLVGLAVGGIALGLGGNALSNTVTQYQATSTLSQLQSDLFTVRATAIASGCPYMISFNATGTSYSASSTSSCYSGAFDDTDRLSLSRTLPSSLAITGVSSLTFNARGFLVAANGTASGASFSLQRDGTSIRAISVSSIGGVV